MIYINKPESVTKQEICQSDVHYIRDTAYVVKEKEEGGKIIGGCVVDGNEEFGRLMNFELSELRKGNDPCYKIFDGVQQQGEVYVQVCHKGCGFRSKGKEREESCVIRNLWINSKVGHIEIKRLVDVIIFPFDTEENRFTLHILIDKRKAHLRKDFNEMIRRTSNVM